MVIPSLTVGGGDGGLGLVDSSLAADTSCLVLHTCIDHTKKSHDGARRTHVVSMSIGRHRRVGAGEVADDGPQPEFHIQRDLSLRLCDNVVNQKGSSVIL